MTSKRMGKKVHLHDMEPRRREILCGLTQIFMRIRHEPSSYVEEEFLQKLSIEVYPMELDIEKSKTSFFVPLSKTILEDCWANENPQPEWRWPDRDPYNSETFTLAGDVQHFICEISQEIVYEYDKWESRHINRDLESTLSFICPSAGQQWVVTRVFEKAGPAHPHMGADILEMAEMDDRLLRSELMTLTVLMLQHLSVKRGAPHRLIPVCVFTFAARKVRVLQAYFEMDWRMIIQKSELIDMSTPNLEGLKSLVCWQNCEPTGNTLWDVPPTKVSGDEGIVEQQIVQHGS